MKESTKCFIIHLLAYVGIISIAIFAVLNFDKHPLYGLLIIPVILLWIAIKYAFYLPFHNQPMGAYIYAKIIDDDKVDELNKMFEVDNE